MPLGFPKGGFVGVGNRWMIIALGCVVNVCLLVFFSLYVSLFVRFVPCCGGWFRVGVFENVVKMFRGLSAVIGLATRPRLRS